MNDIFSPVQNKEMNLAWRLVSKTCVSVFLTGKAGTGKTTFLRQLRQMLPKRMVVLAPTGVAAINAEGQTIHSFFQLPFGPIVPGMERERGKSFRMSDEKKDIIRTLDLLVIDEISMVRCDLLDAIDTELRKYRRREKPFGGVQLLLIGDLQQLAPVAKDEEWQLLKNHYSTPYFFGSKALRQIPYATVELTHIYRQQDEDFISILGQIRENRLSSETLARLNTRFIPNFKPPEEEDWIRLTTHNRMADDYNARMLNSLPDRERHFRAEVSGIFPETSYPAEADLVLKKGSQVMFIKNDISGAHEYYNGKIGIVVGFSDEGIAVFSKEDGQHIAVTRTVWENIKYSLDEESKEIKAEIDGVFRQYPLRLAWAITVHKSQGLTFDHAVLDINESFAHGQSYVALSRCRTLEGMVLSRPFEARSVITDSSVNAYISRGIENLQNVENLLPQMMRDYFVSQLTDAFSFDTIYSDLRHLHRIADENLNKNHAALVKILSDALQPTEKELQLVSARFAAQYRAMPEGEELQERIYAAAKYFREKLTAIFSPIMEWERIEIANKQTAKQFERAFSALKLSYKTKARILARLEVERFSVNSYLELRARATLSDDSPLPKARKAAPEKRTKKEPSTLPEDPQLFNRLHQLRTDLARDRKLPPYIIFSDKTLHSLAADKPRTTEQLLGVFGVGAGKAASYGPLFLEAINNYLEEKT